jgi:hypothetical protein
MSQTIGEEIAPHRKSYCNSGTAERPHFHHAAPEAAAIWRCAAGNGQFGHPALDFKSAAARDQYPRPHQ